MDFSGLVGSLNRDFPCEGVEFVEWNGGLPAAKLSNPLCEALVSIHGGHVSEYAPKGSKPLLWLSGKSHFEEGKPIRGGIPVCWPWFGSAAQPAHGFARLRLWRVKSAVRNADGSNTLTLSLSEDASTLALWPHKFNLELKVCAGASLKVELKASNTGDVPFKLTGALHSYFSASDISNVEVKGLDGAQYIDTLNGSSHAQRGSVRFSAETDRLYQDTVSPCVIEDSGWGRRIVVGKEGSRSTVVWNPWVEKSRRMPDFGDEEYHSMLCIEAANAGTDVVSLNPGASHVLATSISEAP